MSTSPTHPTNPPWQQVFDEIVASGLAGDGARARSATCPRIQTPCDDLLVDRNLESAGSFIFDDFHDPAARQRLLGIGERVSRLIAASGGTILSLIDKPDDVRVGTAGRPDAATRLDDDGWTCDDRPVQRPRRGRAPARGAPRRAPPRRRLRGVRGRDRAAGRRHRSRPVPRHRTPRLRPDGSVGDDRASRRPPWPRPLQGHPPRRSGTGRRPSTSTFWEAIKAGIFCPIGDGLVDIGAVLDTLDRVGYNGFATIEQDRVPGSGAPLDDVLKSVAVIAAAMR